jgi:acyl-homoserine-lactone acylase
MQTVPRADGKREVVSGSSYLQIVTFDDHGPAPKGCFSESSNPASKYFNDQTQAFSQKKLRPLPFTEAQIKADPQYQEQRIGVGRHATP